MEHIKLDKEAKILMVGCGNSRMSEQMYDDGFKNMVNMDISPYVIEKMKVYTDKKEKFMEWVAMDATKMTFEDKSFDLVIDKGTIDAVICGDDIEIPFKIMDEMCRVVKHDSNIMLISNSGPSQRKFMFEARVPVDKFEVSYTSETLSGQSELINILRARMGDRPLCEAFKEADILKKACIESTFFLS